MIQIESSYNKNQLISSDSSDSIIKINWFQVISSDSIIRIYLFQVISFSLCIYLFTHEINWRGSAQKNREAAKHPRQIGRLKVHQAEKVHANRRIPSTPNVNEHYSQRVAQKHGANEKCDQLEIDINWNKFLKREREREKVSFTIMKTPPNRNMKKKSAVRPRNEPSSRYLQYLYVNSMLNRKLKPIGPK